jgi:hypothetical protein
MLFSLLYMVLRVIFRLAPSGDERDREVEILVLRHRRARRGWESSAVQRAQGRDPVRLGR